MDREGAQTEEVPVDLADASLLRADQLKNIFSNVKASKLRGET